MDNLVFLPDLAGNSLPIEKVRLHWTISDEAIVNEGDVVMEVITNLDTTHTVVAHKPGVFIRFWDKDITVARTEYQEKDFKIADTPKVCIGGIFDSHESFINSFFKYKEKVVIDSFTNEKSINWVRDHGDGSSDHIGQRYNRPAPLNP